MIVQESCASRKPYVIAGIFLALAIGLYAVAQMQDFPNRREGTTDHKDALHEFVLMAVHRNFKPFPRNSDLKVRFFLPKLNGAKDRKVSLRAIALQGSSHYFMESKESFPWENGVWNYFKHWPTRDVIDPLDIHASNIGVLAQYRVGNDRPVVLPVDVYRSEKELTRSVYTFHFMSAKDLQALEVSVTNAQGKPVKIRIPDLKCNKKSSLECVKYFSQERSSFDLDFSSLPEGEYHVKLVGRVLNDAAPLAPPEIVLYHHR